MITNRITYLIVNNNRLDCKEIIQKIQYKKKVYLYRFGTETELQEDIFLKQYTIIEEFEL